MILDSIKATLFAEWLLVLGVKLVINNVEGEDWPSERPGNDCQEEAGDG